ncbi:MAG: hypothetical protein HC875_19860 [Anaerolineales bacterium]|nr:hypothetical protein [Anaerolineales bacterium]
MTDRERRSSRREERRARAGTQTVSAVKPLVNTLPLTEVLSPEGIEAIHRASMRLLQDPGILVIDYPPPAKPLRPTGPQWKASWCGLTKTPCCILSARLRPPLPNWPATRLTA